MVDTVVQYGQGVLVLLRLVLFGLTLGITLISFQAYQKRRSERLQFAFIGFAFISMGVAVSNIVSQMFASQPAPRVRLFFDMTQTVPFIIGFAMLYVSLYR
ncbi:DUF7521 family protein [Halorhabdus tiamatea]|uniref:Uncharacterized protein n=1 Tax=Halorhabdus tiamatea SARL4B TaxID=1033806 RepID=F7PR31_9EURY|nr:hypothetical protein [Halorhabdus tiamatea]CCQ33723.1 conserved hypothetical protein [Halorhabdus tiamatea SARL4B]